MLECQFVFQSYRKKQEVDI